MLLLATDVSALGNEHYFNKAYGAVSKERRAKTDKCAKKSDKCLSLGAELLLKAALEKIGENSDGLEFEYGKHQKPYLKNRDVYFNLSHSGKFVLCALDTKDVGCDIEKIKSADMKIAKRFFCESEYEHILFAESEEKRNALFFRYWTLKESFIKAVGGGTGLAPNDFRMVFEKDKISVNQAINEKKYHFREFEEIANYRIALCAENNVQNVSLQVVDLF